MQTTKQKSTKTKKSQNINQLIDKKINNALSRNVELKWFSQIKTSTTSDYNGAVWDLCLVPQGDTDITRDGDRIHLKVFRFKCDWINASTSNPSIGRVIIFQWFGADVPTAAKVLLLVGQAEAVHSPYERDYFSLNGGESGIILKDIILQLDGNGSTNQGFCPRLINLEMKSGFRPNMQYVSGSTAGSNHIYALTITDKVTSNLPSFRFYSELNFTDS